MKRSIIIVVLIIIHEMVCAQIDSIHVIEWKSKDCMADVSTLRLEDYTETVWGIDIEMVYVGGGTLRKFAENDDKLLIIRYDYVAVDAFYISKFEVTQELWETVMGMGIEQARDKATKRYGKKLDLCGVGASYPMYYVSWEDAKTFCDELSRKTGKKYRLPTKDEKSYALCNGSIIHQDIVYEENTALQRRVARRLKRNSWRNVWDYGHSGRVCGRGFRVVCEP